MADIENLWPSDLIKPEIVLPKELLLKQADFLGQLTKNVVLAEVRTTSGFSHGSNEPSMVHEFVIKAPSMGSYQFTLLRVMHNFNIYPVGIYNNLTEEIHYAHSEEELTRALTLIFGLPQTRNAIATMAGRQFGV